MEYTDMIILPEKPYFTGGIDIFRLQALKDWCMYQARCAHQASKIHASQEGMYTNIGREKAYKEIIAKMNSSKPI
jgi:hypothetical protein